MKFRTLIAGAAALGLLLAWVWDLHVLVLQDTRSGRWAFVRAVSPGDSFTLCYTHSVKKKPVWDFYIIDERYEIMEYKTVFPASDFGLPSRAVGNETYTMLADGYGCISGMRRIIPTLMLRVERAYNNIFTFNETVTRNLSQTLGDCVVDMHIQKMNLIQYTFHVKERYGE